MKKNSTAKIKKLSFQNGHPAGIIFPKGKLLLFYKLRIGKQ